MFFVLCSLFFFPVSFFVFFSLSYFSLSIFLIFLFFQNPACPGTRCIPQECFQILSVLMRAYVHNGLITYHNSTITGFIKQKKSFKKTKDAVRKNYEKNQKAQNRA
jgi:hypothetical protein